VKEQVECVSVKDRMSGWSMKAAVAFLAVALVILVSSAGGQATNKKKESAQLAEKVSALRDMASRKSVIRFNGNKFREYVKGTPRNYSMIVMFTALSSSRQCMICKEAMDEYTIVANSFRYSPAFASNKVFLAMVDFDEGPDVFQLMKLNSAPVFMHFPEKGKPKKVDTMDLQRKGFGADAMPTGSRTGRRSTSGYSGRQTTKEPSSWSRFWPWLLASFTFAETILSS